MGTRPSWPRGDGGGGDNDGDGDGDERLGMRTDWVWAQARAGRIPHVRLGRYRRS